ncbi:hypothetical protein HK405_006432, partial [Cladochytrium tenue]
MRSLTPSLSVAFVAAVISLLYLAVAVVGAGHYDCTFGPNPKDVFHATKAQVEAALMDHDNHEGHFGGHGVFLNYAEYSKRVNPRTAHTAKVVRFSCPKEKRLLHGYINDKARTVYCGTFDNPSQGRN